MLHKLRSTVVPSCKLPDCDEESIRRNNDRLKRRLKRNVDKTTSKVKCERKNSFLLETTNMEFNNLAVNHNINFNYSISQTNDNVQCDFIHGSKEKSILTSKNKFSKVIFEKEGEINLIHEPKVIIHEPATVKLISIPNQSQNENEFGIDITRTKLTSKDFGIQVDAKFKFLKLIKNEEQLKTATGIESFEILKVIVESVKVASKNKYETERFTVNTEDRVVMTYVKLKQNLSYSFLALIFGDVTPVHCKTIFIETVRTLSECLTEIPWSSKEKCNKYMPQNFEGFEDTKK